MEDLKTSETHDIVVGRQDAKPQRRRKPKSNAFSPAKRQRFLDALAYTCNVRMAADHAGVDHTTVYYHRARDPVFVEQWREALSAGYDRLEALVLEHGGAAQSLDPADPGRAEAEAPIPFDFDRALRVLAQYRSARAGRSTRTVEPPGRSGGAGGAQRSIILPEREDLGEYHATLASDGPHRADGGRHHAVRSGLLDGRFPAADDGGGHRDRA